MDPAAAQLTGAAIGAAANTGSSILNYISQQETNRQNRNMVNQQNQWNLRQWERENAYNSPSNVIARLRAAGLNPALMYEGGAGQLSSAPSPDMQSSRDVAPQMTGMPTISDFVSLSSAMSQSKLAQAQADYYKSLGQTEDTLREERLNSLILSNKNMEKQTKELDERIKEYVDKHKITEAQLEQFKFDRVMSGKLYMLDRQRLKMDEKMTDKQINKLDADIQKILAEKNVTEREYQEMIWTFAIRKTGLVNQVNLTAAQISTARATARKLGFEGDLIEGSALTEKDYSENLQGKHGVPKLIIATLRSGLQMLTRDFGNILGVMK